MTVFCRHLILPLLMLMVFGTQARAHESRPGYLQLHETSPGHYDVLWKQPANGQYALHLVPTFPNACALSNTSDRSLIAGAVLSHYGLACPGGIEGQTIFISGLDLTLTDVIVRLEKLDGTDEVRVARPAAPSVKLAGGQSALERAGNYFRIGIEHILTGPDHLLFVLGLLMIVCDRWALIKTVSAFTLGHSITLAAATLKVATVPVQPLNAAIALSILFLGPEIVRFQRGETSFTIRHPWVVAFVFGMLHGFGFASGLTAMGLPHAEIPLALLLFNCGVEVGQLAFVLLVLGLERSFRVLEVRLPRPVAQLPTYLVGVLGAFWTFQRLAIFLGVPL